MQELGKDDYAKLVADIIAAHKPVGVSAEPDLDRLVPDYSGLDFKSAPKVSFTYIYMYIYTWVGEGIIKVSCEAKYEPI